MNKIDKQEKEIQRVIRWWEHYKKTAEKRGYKVSTNDQTWGIARLEMCNETEFTMMDIPEEINKEEEEKVRSIILEWEYYKNIAEERMYKLSCNDDDESYKIVFGCITCDFDCFRDVYMFLEAKTIGSLKGMCVND
jgi:hypothetical protein